MPTQLIFGQCVGNTVPSKGKSSSQRGEQRIRYHPRLPGARVTSHTTPSRLVKRVLSLARPTRYMGDASSAFARSLPLNQSWEWHIVL